MKTIDVVIGGNAGSEGKGKIVAYMASKTKYDMVICHHGSNAGHTAFDEEGNKYITRQLPMGLLCKDAELIIGAGAIIDLEVLLQELEQFEKFNVKNRLMIHPRAAIITAEDKSLEAAQLKSISSTMKGVGAASAAKIMRTSALLARNVSALKRYVVHDLDAYILEMAMSGKRILIEGAQGFDLDINHGWEYPYCTSRQCNVQQLLADSGIPHNAPINKVVAVIRPYPIRVGNLIENDKVIGSSGSLGEEVQWADIAEASGYPLEDLLAIEKTTVTNRQRRVFKLDIDRVALMAKMNGVTDLALNFVDYIDYKMHDKLSEDDLTPNVISAIQYIEMMVGVPITMLGTGRGLHHTIELKK